jgi:PIN domain nuclease of toxin-antitoxin system
VIWIVEDAPLEPEAKASVTREIAAGRPIHVSPISAWERGMLVAKGRLRSRLDPKVWFRRLLERPELTLAPISPDILTDASFLPAPIHGDPADRIVIATARALDLTVVTRDRLILAYARRGLVRALSC